MKSLLLAFGPRGRGKVKLKRPKEIKGIVKKEVGKQIRGKRLMMEMPITQDRRMSWCCERGNGQIY